MARKRIIGVKLVPGAPTTGWQTAHVDRLVWLEDGKQFSREEARELVARAVNAGEAFYVQTPDGTEAPVRAQLRHGTYQLTAQADATTADPLLALPVHTR